MNKLQLIGVLLGGLFVLGMTESVQADHCGCDYGYPIGVYSAPSYYRYPSYGYSYYSRPYYGYSQYPYYGYSGSGLYLGFGLGYHGHGHHHYGHHGYYGHGYGHHGYGHHGGGHH